MRTARRTTVRRYNLFLELTALLLAALLLSVALWATLAEINQRYLDLRLADAAKMRFFFESHLDEARKTLAVFAALPEAERTPAVLRLTPTFSDVYLLNTRHQVVRVYRSAPGSKVFPGFSFTGGKVAEALRSVGPEGSLSDVTRGQEDDAPSVYLAVRSGACAQC